MYAFVYAFIIYLFINFTLFYCIFLSPGPRQEAKKAEVEDSLNEGCLTELRIAISHFPTPSVGKLWIPSPCPHNSPDISRNTQNPNSRAQNY